MGAPYRYGRGKQAGGTDFSVYIKNPDAKRAFSDALDRAGHEKGHGGYSGTIAEKSSFIIRDRTPRALDAAHDWAYRDMEQHDHDKWGPAWAIPVAGAAKEKKRELQVKVEAEDEHKARAAATEGLRGAEKPGHSYSYRVDKLELVRAGGVPVYDAKPGDSYFSVFSSKGYAGDILRKYGTRAEAVKAVKAEMAARPNTWTVGQGPVVVKITELVVVTVTGKPSKLAKWLVSVNVTESELGQVEGWLFYGVASS